MAGIDLGIKILEVEGHTFKAQIWDSSGTNKPQSFLEYYIKGAKGAFLVYDITNKNSFDCLDEFLKKFKELVDEKAHVVIIGNKCDL